MRRQSQAIAMSLRWLLYVVEPGSEYKTYPNGSGSVLVAYTEQEREEAARERDRLLTEWESADPDGLHSWKAETAAMQGGDDSALAKGWSALMLAENGMRIVDPCAYCRECRSR